MCKELSTAMVVGCALQKRSRMSVSSRNLAKAGRALLRSGILVNVSYPAVKKVACNYPEITVCVNAGNFVVRKASPSGILFDPEHIRIAYAGSLRDGEFKKAQRVIKTSMSRPRK